MAWVDRSYRFARLALLAGGALPLMAISQVPGPIEIGPSWGSADPANNSAALYTSFVNHGVLVDRVAGVSCPGFGDVAERNLDPSTQGDRPQDKGLLLPPGQTVNFSPGGPSLVLTNLPAPLAPGALVGCTVHLVHSGERIVVFGIGAPGPRVQEP